jgi:hypothetical protein
MFTIFVPDMAMAKTLDVYLHRDLVGQLKQDDGGQMSFAYAESWLEGAHPRRVFVFAARVGCKLRTKK